MVTGEWEGGVRESEEKCQSSLVWAKIGFHIGFRDKDCKDLVTHNLTSQAGQSTKYVHTFLVPR